MEAELLKAIAQGNIEAVRNIIPEANGQQTEEKKEKIRALFTPDVIRAGVDARGAIDDYLRSTSEGYEDQEQKRKNNYGFIQPRRVAKSGKRKTRKSKKSKKSRKSRRV
jgi:hypothetical protein